MLLALRVCLGRPVVALHPVRDREPPAIAYPGARQGQETGAHNRAVTDRSTAGWRVDKREYIGHSDNVENDQYQQDRQQ